MIRTTGVWPCIATSLVTAAYLGPQRAAAQSDADALAALRACGAIEGDRDRLACFDRALGGERVEPLGTEPAEPLVAAPVESLAPERRSVEPAAAAAIPAAVGIAAPAATQSARVATTAVAPPPVSARPASDPSAPAEQARADQPRIVTIVDVNASLAGAARFLTDTGQLIIQTSGGTPRGGYPDVPFDAELQDGALGSLFLAVDERRRVRVVLSE